jgi:DNA-binding response OmpR family regulator
MTTQAGRILLVQEDPKTQKLLSGYLAQFGFETLPASGIQPALETLGRQPVDAVLLASMLPDCDGLQAIAQIRGQSAVPIVLVRTEEDRRDVLPALQNGASDFLDFPCEPEHALARLRAVFFRERRQAAQRLTVGNLEVDIASRTLKVSGAPADLTGIEFDLLTVLMKHSGEVVSREQLLSEAGRESVAVGERTVDVHISHLRRKLGEAPGAGRRIRAVRGMGYVLTQE